MVYSLILLTLPSWIARFAIRKEKIGLKGLEDLGIGACFLLLFHFVPYLPFLLVPILQCLILLDAYMERKLNLRLEISYFTFFSRVGEFWDSAKEIRLHWFVPVAVVCALSSIFARTFSTWTVGIACLPLMTAFRRKKQSHLLVHYLMRRKQKVEKGMDPTPYLSNTEISKPLSPRYPLYRNTKGFHGEKAFDLEVKPGEKPHVIFLFIESLGGQNLGIEGVTPNLDRLREEGIHFPHFYANALQTFRALYAALYGLPFAPTREMRLDTKLPVTGLLEILKKDGYQSNFINGASWSLNNLKMFLEERGADSVIGPREIIASNPDAEEFSWGVFDQYLFEYTLDHFIKHREDPQFYSLMTISTHHPYTLPQGNSDEEGRDYRKFLRTLSYTDGCLGRFLDSLDQEGLLEDTLLFVMGDHGNSLSESTDTLFFASQTSLESYHIPLIVYGKERGKKGQIVETEGSQADLMFTLMDLLKLQGEHHGVGRSLQRKGSHPFFLYNFSNPENDYRVRGRQENPTSYRDFLLTLYDKSCFFPKKRMQGKGSHYHPPHGISEGELISEIKGFGELYSIDLSSQENMTDRVLEEIARTSPTLGILNIERCFLITDPGVKGIAAHCRDLFSIRISHCPLLSEASVDSLLDLPDLDLLCLAGLDFVDDHWVLASQRTKKKVMELSLVNTYVREVSYLHSIFPCLSVVLFSYSLIDPQSLVEFVKKGSLFRLDLYECQKLTDDILTKILASGKTIKALTLGECHQLTDAMFHALKGSRIHTLKLTSPSNLTDKGLEALLSLSLSHLEINGCEVSVNPLKIQGGSLF